MLTPSFLRREIRPAQKYDPPELRLSSCSCVGGRPLGRKAEAHARDITQTGAIVKSRRSSKVDIEGTHFQLNVY